MSYYLEVEENDAGDLYVTLPEEALEMLGWEPGTLLTWDLRGDGIVISRLDGEGGFEPLE